MYKIKSPKKFVTNQQFNYISKSALGIQYWDAKLWSSKFGFTKNMVNQNIFLKSIARTVEKTNEMIKNFNYIVNTFDGRIIRDIVTVKVEKVETGEKFEARFPVEILRPVMPVLSERNDDTIAKSITIGKI